MGPQPPVGGGDRAWGSIIGKRGRNEDTSIVKFWTSTTLATPRGALLDEDFQIWIDWLVRDGQIEAGQVAPKDIHTNQFQPRPLAEAHSEAVKP